MLLWRAVAQQPNIFARLYRSQCVTLTNKLTTHQGSLKQAEQNPGADL